MLLCRFEAAPVHLNEGSRFLGSSARAFIDQVGETVAFPETPFQVVQEFHHLHAL